MSWHAFRLHALTNATPNALLARTSFDATHVGMQAEMLERQRLQDLQKQHTAQHAHDTFLAHQGLFVCMRILFYAHFFCVSPRFYTRNGFV